VLQNINLLLRVFRKSSTFAAVFKKPTQSFLYLKKSNRLIPWKNSRRETAFFFGITKRSEAIPSRSRQKETAFFFGITKRSEAIPSRSRQKETAFFLDICVYARFFVLLQAN